MAFTSLTFLIMVFAAAVVYYLVPVKVRPYVILIANLYYLFSCNSIVFFAIWVATAVLAYLVAVISAKAENGKTKKAVTSLGVIIIALAMIVLRRLNFAPVGISYYSLIYMAYILDAYWGVGGVEYNIFKFLAFAGYFPLFTSGPIVKFDEVGKQIIDGNVFEFKDIVFGSERILWGLMKKMIIADRISKFVDVVYLAPYTYNGLYITVATVFFVIQLYMDFSGCVDIALGVAEIFGITLPENFDMPFASQTIEEFWRRWHITLGGWLRDYIFYPILKSSLWQNMITFCKKIFGKKYGKKIPTWIALLISWVIIGFWHGGHWNYVFGVGLYMGTIIVLGEALEPVFSWVNKALHINTQAFSFKLFRIIRTWALLSVGLLFFRAGGFRRALELLKLSFETFNPWIFFDGSLYNVGLTTSDYHILLFFAGIVVIAAALKKTAGKSVRVLLSEQNIVFQWILVLGLIYAIIVYGCYGVGFNSASFIYQGF